jgi:oxygen-dependent protoporphyrinogen oxidase
LIHLNDQKRAYTAAVLGGGITGLTAAWQLTQDPTCKQVILFEKTDRLGGWINSETVPVDGGNVVFEYGPRTLKSSLPGSLPLLYLVSIARVRILRIEKLSYADPIKRLQI